MSRAEQNLRIDYIELRAVDLEAAKAFYQSAFEWTFTDYGPDYSSFNDGRTNGGIERSAEAPGRGALVVLYATDLEGTEAKLKELGATVVREIFSFPGGRRFHFKDPAGNELAVWSDQ